MHLGTITGGEHLRLPIESATQTFAIIAIKGAGKTYAAKVMMEEFSAAGVKFVALDPTGVLWGLRSAADGVGPGLSNVVIIGGPHGDYPLDARAGSLIADIAVDYAESIVVDLSGLSKTMMREFAWHFAERLYSRQAYAPMWQMNRTWESLESATDEALRELLASESWDDGI